MSLLTRTMLEDALSEGRLFTIGHTTPSIAAAGTYLFGVTIGSRPVEYMDRSYVSDVSAFFVELYELAYTAGTPVTTTVNRNYVIGGAGPVTHVAAPTAVIAGNPIATVRVLAPSSTGNAQAQVPENERYILKPNTQYVLRLTNQGSNAGTITFRWTYRDTELVP